jgi:hypothetical protein
MPAVRRPAFLAVLLVLLPLTYYGVRAMQTIPITAGAVSDQPTVGAFGGLQIGNRWFSVRPELGVFYDHSALGLRKSDLLVVPAFTLMRGRRRDGG